MPPHAHAAPHHPTAHAPAIAAGSLLARQGGRILVCALIVIYICSQQMETHFFQYLQDPSALAGQQGRRRRDGPGHGPWG